jgi:hypothetical protein
VEISSATRDSGNGTLAFTPSVVSGTFSVANKVVNNIAVNTNGEGSATGEEVQITIAFTTPIILPAGHYFFRPEVLVTGGDFLYLSTPRTAPIFVGDLQAWIRNTPLKPDWLRIGTDIIDGPTPPTFNMAFSLTGDTVPEAGTQGEANCHGQTISALARQFGGLHGAASVFGSSSVQAVQNAVVLFCQP